MDEIDSAGGEQLAQIRVHRRNVPLVREGLGPVEVDVDPSHQFGAVRQRGHGPSVRLGDAASTDDRDPAFALSHMESPFRGVSSILGGFPAIYKGQFAR